MKLFKFPAKLRDITANIICLVIIIGLIIFIYFCFNKSFP